MWTSLVSPCLLLLSLLQFFTIICADLISDGVTVNVTQGTLLGKKHASAGTSNVYFSFQGVPYAKPPLGLLRFKAPQPPEAWTATRDARQEGNVCPQMNHVKLSYEGNEDCLFLNIYTTELPAADEDTVVTKKAVMFFIHGGAFVDGSGNSAMYGPDYFMAYDVLLVTINYRLGALGFATTEDNEIPGNAGLKDQVAALKWVQQNIARFGGDPDNVTIFGESAGAASVHFLMLSPLSKGLFHRAIAQSGCALNHWAFTTAGRSRTLRLAHALGWAGNDSNSVLTHLRTIPAQQLVLKKDAALSSEEMHLGRSPLPFVPTIECGWKTKEKVFLPAAPTDLIESGNYSNVPFIIGVNSLEGLEDLSTKTAFLSALNLDMQGLLPEDLYPQLDTPRSMEAAKRMKHFYFGEQAFSNETLLQFAQLRSDTHFVYKIHEAAVQHAQHGNVFVYQFAFDGVLGIFKRMLGLSEFPGVCHADELGYLFNVSFVQQVASDSAEATVRQMMLNMWTTFAKTGNPSSATVTWLPVAPSAMNYLLIDQQPVLKTDLEKKNVQFWQEMYLCAREDNVTCSMNDTRLSK